MDVIRFQLMWSTNIAARLPTTSKKGTQAFLGAVGFLEDAYLRLQSNYQSSISSDPGEE